MRTKAEYVPPVDLGNPDEWITNQDRIACALERMADALERLSGCVSTIEHYHGSRKDYLNVNKL